MRIKTLEDGSHLSSYNFSPMCIPPHRTGPHHGTKEDVHHMSKVKNHFASPSNMPHVYTLVHGRKVVSGRHSSIACARTKNTSPPKNLASALQIPWTLHVHKREP